LSEIAGDISLGLNVIALIFVTVGIVRRKGSKKVMIRHGFLSLLGFAIKLATVFVVMIPALLVASSDLAELSALPLGLVVVKVVLGIAGDAMGFVCIVPWLLKPVEQMGCYRVKKWMLPTFIIWSISIILGAIIHLGGIM